MIHDLIKHHPLLNKKDIVYNEVDILVQQLYRQNFCKFLWLQYVKRIMEVPSAWPMCLSVQHGLGG